MSYVFKAFSDIKTYIYLLPLLVFVSCFVMATTLYGYAYYNELEAAKIEIVRSMAMSGEISVTEVNEILNKHLSGGIYTIEGISPANRDIGYAATYYGEPIGIKVTRYVSYLGTEHEQSIAIMSNNFGKLGIGYNTMPEYGGGTT